MSEKEKTELSALKKLYDTRGIILIVAGCVLTLAYILGMRALEELLGIPLLFVPMLIAFVPFAGAFWFWRKSAFIDRELAQDVGDDDDDDNDDDDVGDDAPGVPPDDDNDNDNDNVKTQDGATESSPPTETETEE
jgi:hypothetical protein